MSPTDPVLWGIRGGQTGDADTLFLQHGVVALGWVEIGDLTAITPTRDAFKQAVQDAFPGKKPGAIPVVAGQLFRFLTEMHEADLVAYPSKKDKHIHIGRVTGSYRYAKEHQAAYAHRRPVTWLTDVPRTYFSQGALYEIGSAMSFFQIKNYADEFRQAAEGIVPTSIPAEDETAAVVAQEIEQSTRDYVLKQLAKELKGHPLAEFVGHLLQQMGYRTRVSPEGPDAGVDIIAHRDELGFEPPIIKVQVKSSDGNIGDPIVSQLYGKVGEREHGLVVTLGFFTAQARAFERNKSNLRLIDGDQLVELILEHYEGFDSRYKGLLPLKRVYVPEPLDDSL